MRPNVAMLSLWKHNHAWFVEKHHDRCGPMSLCFRCWKTIMHDFYECRKTPRPMRLNVAMLSLWKHNHAWFVEKHHDRCGPMSLCFRCGNTIMHDFYECRKTPWPMRPNVAMHALYKQQPCMISTNVEKHHDRCGPMSLCFRCRTTIINDFYEFEKHHDR
jgi:DNA-directed RNA polymerase subunit N (RpoN/RPB10)